jgi:type I restriction enzyme S subunit
MTDLPPSWFEAALEDIAEVRLGRQRSPRTHTGTNMRPYLRAANVTWHGLNLGDVKEMHFEPAEVETYRLKAGDVLVAEASGSPTAASKTRYFACDREGPSRRTFSTF